MLTFQYTVLILILLAFIFIFYTKFLTKNMDELNTFSKDGLCPNCKIQLNEENLDSKGAGCSGTNTISIDCDNCGYSKSFSVAASGYTCGSVGKCSTYKCKG